MVQSSRGDVDGRLALGLLVAASAAACHSPASRSCSAAPSASSAPPPTVDAGAASVPITVVTVDDAGTQRLAVPVSINGSPPFLVALDTGAVGLAVFESSLGGTPVSQTTTPLSTTFGGDAQQSLTWSGVEAEGVVQIGSAATPRPIAFQLVKSALCPSFASGCGANAASNDGLGGNLGVSLRAQGYSTPDVFSPIAQLAPPLSDGFTVRLGGLDASAGGTLGLGLPTDASSFSTLSLAPDERCSLANGLPAWQDSVELCYVLNGAPLVPRCSSTYIDTGDEEALVWVEDVPTTASPGDTGLQLAPGQAVEVTAGATLDLRFTSGASSPERVGFYTGGSAVSALGRPLFARYDVEFDIRHGWIGFGPTQ